jgi:hypothetical protein
MMLARVLLRQEVQHASYPCSRLRQRPSSRRRHPRLPRRPLMKRLLFAVALVLAVFAGSTLAGVRATRSAHGNPVLQAAVHAAIEPPGHQSSAAAEQKAAEGGRPDGRQRGRSLADRREDRAGSSLRHHHLRGRQEVQGYGDRYRKLGGGLRRRKLLVLPVCDRRQPDEQRLRHYRRYGPLLGARGSAIEDFAHRVETRRTKRSQSVNVTFVP